MRCWTLLSLLLLGRASAAARQNRTLNLRVEGAEPLTVGDMDAVKFIASVFDDDLGSHLGNGVILSKFFVLVSRDLAAPYVGADTSALFMSAGYLSPLANWPDDFNGIYRQIQEAYVYPDYDPAVNPIIGNVGLFRACPSIPEGFFGEVPIASSLAGSEYRDVATLLTYYQLQEDEASGILILHSAQKNVAEKCECLYDNDWWDSAYHVCVQYHDDVWAWDPEDESGVIVTNEDTSEVLGILMTFEDNWGEVALWLHQEDQRAWLEDTADDAPHEYPPEP